VIYSCLHSAAASGTWCLDPTRTFSRQCGSGNNWQYGYGVHGPKCEAAILELVDREVALTPNLAGFLLIQSVAGGTGSGLGGYLVGC
jgi:tubulin delta